MKETLRRINSTARRTAHNSNFYDVLNNLKEDLSKEEHRWFMDRIKYEEQHHTVLSKEDLVTDPQNFFYFLHILHKFNTNHETELALTTQDKIRVLTKLKDYTQREEPAGLCNILNDLWQRNEITVQEYIYVRKEIRKELKQRNHTQDYGNSWLCNVNDKQTRINFIDILIRQYK